MSKGLSGSSLRAFSIRRTPIFQFTRETLKAIKLLED